MKPAFLFPITSLFSRLLLAGLPSLALADTFTPILTTDLTDTNSGDSRCNAFVDFIFSRRLYILQASILGTDFSVYLPLMIKPGS